MRCLSACDFSIVKDNSYYLDSFQRNHLVVQKFCLQLNFFVHACIFAFSAHLNLLYIDNKYANRTMTCTSLLLELLFPHGLCGGTVDCPPKLQTTANLVGTLCLRYVPINVIFIQIKLGEHIINGQSTVLPLLSWAVETIKHL